MIMASASQLLLVQPVGTWPLTARTNIAVESNAPCVSDIILEQEMIHRQHQS